MKLFKKSGTFSLTLVLSTVALLSFIVPTSISAATSPGLGTATSFSILAGTSITNIPTSSISGDVGLSPATGSNITALTDAEVSGTIYTVDAFGPAGSVMNPSLLLTALADTAAAYGALDAQTCDITYAGTKDLVGEILVPGVYCATAFELTGTLTLNGAASDVWIFKSTSSLVITGNTANIVFSGGGQACNVWWRVVSTASFTANTSFAGNILADTSITFGANVTLNGRALARTAEVTLSSTTISGPTCAVVPGLPQTGKGTEQTSQDITWLSIPVAILFVLASLYLSKRGSRLNLSTKR